MSRDLSRADRGDDKGALTQAWATLATAETLGSAAETKAAKAASAIMAAATCTATVSRSQEAYLGADTQAGTRCCTSTPTAEEATTSRCLCCLAKCDMPGRRCSAARQCTCRQAAPGTDMCIRCTTVSKQSILADRCRRVAFGREGRDCLVPRT
jgi:hypothetical protein